MSTKMLYRAEMRNMRLKKSAFIESQMRNSILRYIRGEFMVMDSYMPGVKANMAEITLRMRELSETWGQPFTGAEPKTYKATSRPRGIAVGGKEVKKTALDLKIEEGEEKYQKNLLIRLFTQKKAWRQQDELVTRALRKAHRVTKPKMFADNILQMTLVRYRAEINKLMDLLGLKSAYVPLPERDYARRTASNLIDVSGTVNCLCGYKGHEVQIVGDSDNHEWRCPFCEAPIVGNSFTLKRSDEIELVYEDIVKSVKEVFGKDYPAVRPGFFKAATATLDRSRYGAMKALAERQEGDWQKATARAVYAAIESVNPLDPDCKAPGAKAFRESSFAELGVEIYREGWKRRLDRLNPDKKARVAYWKEWKTFLGITQKWVSDFLDPMIDEWFSNEPSVKDTYWKAWRSAARAKAKEMGLSFIERDWFEVGVFVRQTEFGNYSGKAAQRYSATSSQSIFTGDPREVDADNYCGNSFGIEGMKVDFWHDAAYKLENEVLDMMVSDEELLVGSYYEPTRTQKFERSGSSVKLTPKDIEVFKDLNTFRESVGETCNTVRTIKKLLLLEDDAIIEGLHLTQATKKSLKRIGRAIKNGFSISEKAVVVSSETLTVDAEAIKAKAEAKGYLAAAEADRLSTRTQEALIEEQAEYDTMLAQGDIVVGEVEAMHMESLDFMSGDDAYQMYS